LRRDSHNKKEWILRSRVCSAFVLFGLTALLSAASHAATPTPRGKLAVSWSVGWQPMPLVNGAPVVFRVGARLPLESLSGNWLGHEVLFSFEPRSRVWYALAGVSLETAPGVYSLRLKGDTAGGNEISFERQIAVRRAHYPRVAITVGKQFTAPSPEQLQAINQDKTLKADVFRHVDPKRQWAGKFQPPVVARVSDVFGTRRTFNGETRSTHQGLDYAVPAGTPVAAVNGGTILLARPLFFEGNCVVLDHGQGLLTLYLHLSEFKVKEGEHVARGQVLGFSGGTGRATGPHLHVAVRWQGVYVNPATLLELSLP
jgi:murein DD-endopeptidase MepM/ murein hydrolase activator NlpD